MTVKQLRESLVGLDDDVQVLVPAPDHCYRATRSADTTDAVYSDNEWSEYDEETGLEMYEDLLEVLVIQ